MATTKKTNVPADLIDADQVEIEFKRMQIQVMREQMEERQQRKERLQADRERNMRDFKASQRDLDHRQRVCKHRKGGRNNNFAKGNSADYSVVQNTYPNGSQGVMCTRCGKEVRKPDVELKQKDPKAYAEAWALWVEWSGFPTDNSPSGSKIFEIQREAA